MSQDNSWLKKSGPIVHINSRRFMTIQNALANNSMLSQNGGDEETSLRMLHPPRKSSLKEVPSISCALSMFNVKRGGGPRPSVVRRSSVGMSRNNQPPFNQQRPLLGPIRRNRENTFASPRKSNLRPLMSVVTTPLHMSTPIEKVNSILRPNRRCEGRRIPKKVNFDSSQIVKKDEVVEEPVTQDKITVEKIDASTNTDSDQCCERKDMARAMVDLLEKMQEFHERFGHLAYDGKEKPNEKGEDVVLQQSRFLSNLEDICEENEVITPVPDQEKDSRTTGETACDLVHAPEASIVPVHDPVVNELVQSVLNNSKTESASNEEVLPPPAKKPKDNACSKNEVTSSPTVTTPRLSARIRQRTEKGRALCQRVTKKK